MTRTVFNSLISLVVLVVMPALAGEPVKLFPGWSRVLEVPGVTKAVSADPSVAEVVTSDKGAQVDAKKEGTTTVTLTTKAGSQTLEVKVEKSGWDLDAVMVAAHDLAEDTMLTKADLVEAWVPKALLTSSAVKPSNVSYVLGHKTMVPIQAHDFILWSHMSANPKDVAPPQPAKK